MYPSEWTFDLEEIYQSGASGPIAVAVLTGVLPVNEFIPNCGAPSISKGFVSYSATGGNIAGGSLLYVQVAASLTASDGSVQWSPPSEVLPISIPPGTNTNTFTLGSIQWPEYPGLTGYTVFVGIAADLICAQITQTFITSSAPYSPNSVTIGDSISVSTPPGQPFARSSYATGNSSTASIQVLGKYLIHGGVEGGSVTALNTVAPNTLTSDDCIDSTGADNWTGRKLAIIGRYATGGSITRSFTDLYIDVLSYEVGSSSYLFQPSDIGNFITITGGVGFVPGVYLIEGLLYEPGFGDHLVNTGIAIVNKTTGVGTPLSISGTGVETSGQLAGAVTGFTIDDMGGGYNPGDLAQVVEVSATSPCVLQIDTVTSPAGGVLTAHIVSPGAGNVAAANLTTTAETGTGTGLTVSLTGVVSGSVPFAAFNVTAFDPSTGAFTLDRDPQAAGVRIGDELAVCFQGYDNSATPTVLTDTGISNAQNMHIGEMPNAAYLQGQYALVISGTNRGATAKIIGNTATSYQLASPLAIDATSVWIIVGATWSNSATVGVSNPDPFASTQIPLNIQNYKEAGLWIQAFTVDVNGNVVSAVDAPGRMLWVIGQGSNGITSVTWNILNSAIAVGGNSLNIAPTVAGSLYGVRGQFTITGGSDFTMNIYQNSTLTYVGGGVFTRSGGVLIATFTLPSGTSSNTVVFASAASAVNLATTDTINMDITASDGVCTATVKLLVQGD
jgi:hypothetical protein